MIGYEQALKLTLENIHSLDHEVLPLAEVSDRISAEDLDALVDVPSADVSLKDGFAVISEDIEQATPGCPVMLKLKGTLTAGQKTGTFIEKGTAIRILSGAKIPPGSNAVVSEEFVENHGTYIKVTRNAEPGRNILKKGNDISKGERVISRGEKLVPGKVGILAASGYEKISVFKRPSVGLIATGDEVVAPGKPLPEGKLFASNLLTLNAWCRHYGMRTEMEIVGDQPERMIEKLNLMMQKHDAILTSGGAWTGERDFIVSALEHLGWRKIFHRIRIGPGKAVGFGLIQKKPIFILPGGPPSNLMAFLQIALPGLMKLSGYKHLGLPRMKVTLAETVVGREINWTQFVFGEFEEKEDQILFHPLKLMSRLQSMAKAEGIIEIPEGVERIIAGTAVTAQILI